MTATPLPENLIPDTGGKVDPTDLARRVQANFDALSLVTGTSRFVAGTGTVTVAAALGGAAGTINHTLGQVPRVVVLTPGTAQFGTYYGSLLIYQGGTSSTIDVYAANMAGYVGGVVVNVHYILVA